jgi:FAD:protein FMN transferase
MAVSTEIRVCRLRPAMGTWLALEAWTNTEERAVGAITAGYFAIQEVERWLHPSRKGSDIAGINAAPPGQRVPVAAMTWELLQLARSMWELSDGIFDPCLPSQPGRLCDLTLSGEAGPSPWASCRLPVALDLGGIAKGYAIDRGIEALRAAGCASGLINAGGDLRVYGRSQTVLLREPDGNYVPLTLEDQALAVTDLEADTARRPLEHRGYHHRGGELLAARRYAAVVAASAAIADGLTKCALLASPQDSARTLRAFRAHEVPLRRPWAADVEKAPSDPMLGRQGINGGLHGG